MKYLVQCLASRKCPPSDRCYHCFCSLRHAFPGSVPALPGPGVWQAGGALPLCPGLPPENAARGRKGGRGWSAEPDADGRPNQHRLGGLARRPPRPGFRLPACLELRPVTSEDISQHARSLPFFKHHAVGLDRLAGLTPSDLAQRSGEVSSLLTNLTLLGLHPPKVKSYAVHTEGSSPFPPHFFSIINHLLYDAIKSEVGYEISN